ncbi:MAG: MotA/TolQ/ExbB proton channel family protein [Deltaproteobacteria bacterium]|nr:MotA/TolQ/ExbB proton channel family protein [Deltaproteobacteria bacterium]
MPPGPETIYGINVFEQVIQSRGMVLAVLVLLIGLSVFSWFVIGYKWLLFRRIRKDTERFFDIFWRSETLDAVESASEGLPRCPTARLFHAAYTELNRFKGTGKEDSDGSTHLGGGFENIERALRRAVQDEISHLEHLVGFLATTGSAAPFIGLFGTVWGIMNAFAYIHPDRPILETVTPHIAQALVATAIGLLAAIPAVMAYNYFTGRIRNFTVEMDNFSIDFLNILKRHFFKD